MSSNKPISVPRVKFETKNGKFSIRVARNDLVQISGIFQHDKQDYPFSLTLQKDGQKQWHAVEAGVEKFVDMVIATFALWADKHPRLFQMADRIHSHNRPPGIPVKFSPPKKRAARSSSSR